MLFLCSFFRNGTCGSYFLLYQSFPSPLSVISWPPQITVVQIQYLQPLLFRSRGSHPQLSGSWDGSDFRPRGLPEYAPAHCAFTYKSWLSGLPALIKLPNEHFYFPTLAQWNYSYLGSPEIVWIRNYIIRFMSSMKVDSVFVPVNTFSLPPCTMPKTEHVYNNDNW